MARSALYDVACAECGTETEVCETVWPQTRWDPADGETSPEECPNCGKPFGPEDAWAELEPPEEPRRGVLALGLLFDTY